MNIAGATLKARDLKRCSPQEKPPQQSERELLSLTNPLYHSLFVSRIVSLLTDAERNSVIYVFGGSKTSAALSGRRACRQRASFARQALLFLGRSRHSRRMLPVSSFSPRLPLSPTPPVPPPKHKHTHKQSADTHTLCGRGPSLD